MTTLDQILHLAARDFPAAGIDCLLIGGFAVNHFFCTKYATPDLYQTIREEFYELKT